jgi:hypothetical protein
MGFEESKRARPKTASNYQQWQSVKAKEQLNFHQVGAPVDGSTIKSYAQPEPNRVSEMVAKNRNSNIHLGATYSRAAGPVNSRITSH